MLRSILFLLILTSFPALAQSRQAEETAPDPVSALAIHGVNQVLNRPELENPPPETSLLAELGYILAMEAAFTGLSLLASQDKPLGHAAAGGFDLFMGVAGIQNALQQEKPAARLGYLALSGGFFAKSLYVFKLGEDHPRRTRFWVNFAAYNLLVFTGYYIDARD